MVTENALLTAAMALGFSLNDKELRELPALVQGLLDGIADLPELEIAPGPKRAWLKPAPGADPLNAFAVLTDISEAHDGPLAGLRVAIKDSVAVAGVPMGDGSSLLNGYLPEFDAEVVQRLLKAGARIVGKTNTECFCASGASFTGLNGPVLNPWDHARSAGGSSSGSAVAVATGLADLALGGDQGGSIRIPAALCGIVGLKPTFGRVPYLGAASVDGSLDHLGPMARKTRDAARMLAVIAGYDPADPRSNAALPAQDWLAACDLSVPGLRIGAVAEGFLPERANAPMAQSVREALARLNAAGAQVQEVSVPGHAKAIATWLPVILYGTLSGMWADGGGAGLTRDAMGSMVRHLSGWPARADELSDILRVILLAGECARRQHGFEPYLRAHSLGRDLSDAYDQALAEVDVLAMPTVPAVAGLLPGPGATTAERWEAAVATTGNTSAFNLTGHPAITVNCGFVDGLPVGLMFVARKGDEASLFRAACAVEAVTPEAFPPPV
ncbi:MAG TPA: amidase family protein [Tabrizicola sp.]|nr:amidase family protein [Tabrizicola sp.]